MWLTPVPPDRAGGGGHIRQAHLFGALSARAEVHLLSSRAVLDPMVRAAAASVTELEVYEHEGANQAKSVRRIRDVGMAVLSRPREVAAFAPVRRAMKPLLAETGASTVVVEYAGLAPLVSNRCTGQRWVLTLHNLGSAMAAQEAAVTRGRRQRWLYQRDATAAGRWEQGMLGRYDRVIAVSEADAQVLDPEGRRNVAVVPNGVDLGAGPARPLPLEPVVVFTGALYTGPNRDGIKWFCGEIWPHVRNQVNGASLWIVGSRPGPDVTELATEPGVQLFPDVAEVRPYLDLARVAVVPLRVGSGTRLKALEAMAATRPVVGTTIGLGGLGLVDGRQAVFADRPEDLARAVVRALIDDAWATSLASQGRRLVEERFGWEPIGNLFADVVLGEVGRGEKAGPKPAR